MKTRVGVKNDSGEIENQYKDITLCAVPVTVVCCVKQFSWGTYTSLFILLFCLLP